MFRFYPTSKTTQEMKKQVLKNVPDMNRDLYYWKCIHEYIYFFQMTEEILNSLFTMLKTKLKLKQQILFFKIRSQIGKTLKGRGNIILSLFKAHNYGPQVYQKLSFFQVCITLDAFDMFSAMWPYMWQFSHKNICGVLIGIFFFGLVFLGRVFLFSFLFVFLFLLYIVFIMLTDVTIIFLSWIYFFSSQKIILLNFMSGNPALSEIDDLVLLVLVVGMTIWGLVDIWTYYITFEDKNKNNKNDENEDENKKVLTEDIFFSWTCDFDLSWFFLSLDMEFCMLFLTMLMVWINDFDNWLVFTLINAPEIIFSQIDKLWILLPLFFPICGWL